MALVVGDEITLDDIVSNEGGRVFECTDEDGYLPTGFLDFIPLMPKSYLVITATHIGVLTGQLWRTGWYTVAEASTLRQLEKLNFRRNEYITLHYKGGRSKRYTMKKSHQCAKALQERMKNIGKIGKTSLTPRKANIVAAARNLFGRAKEYEEEFNMNPSHGVVLQMVNTLREATELMGEVTSEDDEGGDDSYREIVDYFQGLLRRPDIVAVLDAPVDMGADGEGYGGRADADDGGGGGHGSRSSSSRPVEGKDSEGEGADSAAASDSAAAFVASPSGSVRNFDAAPQPTPSEEPSPADQRTRTLGSPDSRKVHDDIARSIEKVSLQADLEALHADEDAAFGLSDDNGGSGSGGSVAEDDEEDDEGDFELHFELKNLQDELDALTGTSPPESPPECPAQSPAPEKEK